MNCIVCIIFALLLLLVLAACSPVVVPSPVLATNKVEAELLPEPTLSEQPTQPAAGDSIGITPAGLDNSFTEANPLTDVTQIEQILNQLQEQQLAWFSHEGWLHYTIDTADASDFTRIQHYWIHVTDKNLGCAEQFVYFESEGEILPYTIRLENGSAARISPLDGNLSTEFVYETTPLCTLKSNWIITFNDNGDDFDFILHDEVARFQDFINQDLPGVEKHVRVWKEDLDGKQTLVLELEKMYTDPSIAGSIYDARTGIYNLPAQSLQWIFIDPENGLPIRERGEFYDQNGQQLNTWRSGTNIGVLFFYEFYDELPQPVAQVYDQTAQALETFIQGGTQ
ncbi:MAG TPA: hypothetical protein DD636_04805 [Anaerolineaceae bacterium]|jgi:hypothetical protein|nr:hypothetical protein [Anaerolineaceae bacterium]